MAAIPICSDFGAQKNKDATVSPSICHEVMGLDAMILVFWMLSFKLAKASKNQGDSKKMAPPWRR